MRIYGFSPGRLKLPAICRALPFALLLFFGTTITSVFHLGFIYGSFFFILLRLLSFVVVVLVVFNGDEEKSPLKSFYNEPI